MSGCFLYRVALGNKDYFLTTQLTYAEQFSR